MEKVAAYAVKLVGGVAHVYNVTTGQLHRPVGINLVSAQIVNPEFVQVTDKHGHTKVYSIKTGQFVRAI